MTNRVDAFLHRRATLVGYVFYVAVLAAGYYYNLTFVQLGLIDLGTRLVGMTALQVSMAMGLLALVAFAVAVVTGVTMDRKGWSSRLRIKLRMLFVVVTVQTILTAVAPSVASPAGFLAWVIGCSAVIGVGIPLTFGLMIDFVPVRRRGAVAAVVAGLSFFAAALYPLEWRMEEFAPVMLAAMIPAVVVLGGIAWGRWEFVDELARQHERFGVGRFARAVPIRTHPFRRGGSTLWMLILLMFAVFFIDSLGFLRILDSPALMATSWQSPEIGIRFFIAAAHVVGAAMAGILYTGLGRRWLLASVFGLFAFTHLLYTFHLATGPAGIAPTLVLPLFYVLAVSFYTTLNFALWPDLSTPATIGTHTALGVGIAGWLASFLSTALALYSRSTGMELLAHLRYVNALALLLAVGFPAVLYVRRMRSLARAEEPA